jgi:hypothetical protein
VGGAWAVVNAVQREGGEALSAVMAGAVPEFPVPSSTGASPAAPLTSTRQVRATPFRVLHLYPATCWQTGSQHFIQAACHYSDLSQSVDHVHRECRGPSEVDTTKHLHFWRWSGLLRGHMPRWHTHCGTTGTQYPRGGGRPGGGLCRAETGE